MNRFLSVTLIAVVLVGAAGFGVGRSLLPHPNAQSSGWRSGDGGASVAAATAVDAGRYLVLVGGCNDCHTPGWDQTDGQVPESQWLIGKPMGFRGPWGTSYPGNVRQFLQTMPEDQWVSFARTWKALPPMPSMNLNRMSESDLRAIHRYVMTLDPVTDLQPGPLPPGETPVTPYVDFTPVMPGVMPGVMPSSGEAH